MRVLYSYLTTGIPVIIDNELNIGYITYAKCFQKLGANSIPWVLNRDMKQFPE